MLRALQILLETKSVSIAAVDRLVLCHWFGAVDLGTVQGFGQAHRSYAARLGAKHILMTVVDVTRATAMDDDAKALSDEHLLAMAPHVAGVAQVVVGSGFRAAAARAIITGQHLVQRPPYAWKIFSDIDSCSAWVASRVDREASAVRGAADALIARAG